MSTNPTPSALSDHGMWPADLSDGEHVRLVAGRVTALAQTVSVYAGDRLTYRYDDSADICELHAEDGIRVERIR